MSRSCEPPLRILHVLACMNRGGVEVWLMHMLRHIDRERFRMDFATSQPGEFDDEIRSLGSQVHRTASPRNPRAFARSLQGILSDGGPYDVVHSHLHYFSGYVLRVAARAGVPARIAHSHNDTTAAETGAGFLRRRYLSLTQSWISRYATHGLACSGLAAKDLFGENWSLDRRWKIIFYSMPFAPFAEVVTDRGRIREDLGIPRDAWVLGHVGRFFEQKNHMFLINVLAEAARRNPNLCLLLVGDGPLRPAIESRVEQLQLCKRVVFAGVRPDVPLLMRNAMDGLLFPSLHEGSPLALVEAQAAGLPCVVSDTIAVEATVVGELVSRRSLSEPISAWVRSIEEMPLVRTTVTPDRALQAVEDSPFEVSRGVLELQSVYRDVVCQQFRGSLACESGLPSAAVGV